MVNPGVIISEYLCMDSVTRACGFCLQQVEEEKGKVGRMALSMGERRDSRGIIFAIFGDYFEEFPSTRFLSHRRARLHDFCKEIANFLHSKTEYTPLFHFCLWSQWSRLALRIPFLPPAGEIERDSVTPFEIHRPERMAE